MLWDTWQYMPWCACWDRSKPVMLWILCNPTGTGHIRGNATATRCINIANRSGFGAAWAVNLFPMVDDSPDAIKGNEWAATGPMADAVIDFAIAQLPEDGRIVCAWGVNGAWHGRAYKVEKRLRDAGHSLYVIYLTDDGFPKHPAMSKGYSVQPWECEGPILR